jgi:hypothetical protein
MIFLLPSLALGNHSHGDVMSEDETADLNAASDGECSSPRCPR